MIRGIKPARAAAEETKTDLLCDLDVLQSTQVTFRFGGRDRKILPITTERFFLFWDATNAYKAGMHGNADEDIGAFFKIIHTVCDDIEPEDIAKMNLTQKALLLTHITSMIVGRNITEGLEKKNAQALAPSASA